MDEPEQRDRLLIGISKLEWAFDQDELTKGDPIDPVKAAAESLPGATATVITRLLRKLEDEHCFEKPAQVGERWRIRLSKQGHDLAAHARKTRSVSWP